MIFEDNRVKDALGIIEATLTSVYDDDITTSQLLMKCQNVAKILGVDDENKWLLLELQGYDLKKKSIPHYRKLKCMGYIAKISTGAGARTSTGLWW
ncbi:MAG: hypothetical protein ACFFEV_03300, partial [Candidatus Thorarchaeota archaeon]